MSRLALLALLTACSTGAPRPTLTNRNQAPVRYTIQPFRMHDGMSRHSALQSWTTYAGALELAVDKATLTLDVSTDRSWVHCAPEMTGYTMQQCAGPEAKDTTVKRSLALEGFSRWADGKLLITVRHEDTSVTLTCDEHGSKLDCAYDDEYTLFSHVGARPQRVVFDRG